MWWLLIGSAGAVVAVSLAILYVRDTARMDPKGKRCVVTGGSSGIGLATAMLLARRGAKVVLLARNEANLKAAAANINSATKTETCSWATADVSNAADLADAIDKAAARMGGLDILVHSAGLSRPGRFEEVPLGEFESLIKVNYLGSVYAARAAVPHMKAAGGGRLIFVSSLAGMTSVQGLTAYSPTKYAVRGLAEGLQMELRPFNIYSTVVNPPDVDTPMLQWEMQHKPVECKRICEGSGTFQPEQVAADIIAAIETWSFYVSTGFDGQLASRLCAGMSPASSLGDTLVEVFFGGIVRLVALFYLKSYNQICDEEHAKRLKAK